MSEPRGSSSPFRRPATEKDWQPEVRRIIEEMRAEGPRYKSHDLGFVDSVSANRVDDWADELEALLPAPPLSPESAPEEK
jgi:hypothetical protein